MKCQKREEQGSTTDAAQPLKTSGIDSLGTTRLKIATAVAHEKLTGDLKEHITQHLALPSRLSLLKSPRRTVRRGSPRLHRTIGGQL